MRCPSASCWPGVVAPTSESRKKNRARAVSTSETPFRAQARPYDSPMSRMQRAEELVGVQRTMELLTPFAQINPEVMDIFDPDALAQLTAEVSGVPMPVLRSPDEVAALREQRAQQQQMAQMAEVAPQMAGAVKDIAQAQALGRQ